MASVPALLLPAEMSDNKNVRVGGGGGSVQAFACNFQEAKTPSSCSQTQLLGGFTHCPSRAFVFFLSACSNGVIYTPTEMSLDAACLNQGEETEREHEGHVRMISHTQLPAGPHLAVSTAPVS